MVKFVEKVNNDEYFDTEGVFQSNTRNVLKCRKSFLDVGGRGVVSMSLMINGERKY
jgi:hypothetical protein